MGVFIRCERCGKDLFWGRREENAGLKEFPRVTDWIYTVKPCDCKKTKKVKER
jgi:hypothetical protein